MDKELRPIPVYETKKLLDQYLGLHYASSSPSSTIEYSCTSSSSASTSSSSSDTHSTTSAVIPSIISHKNAPIHSLHFPQRVAKLIQTLQPIRTSHRALDIGCAVGGSSFELAKYFDFVDAFDFSTQFITAANEMKYHPETVRYHIPMEADIYEEVTPVLDDHVTSQVRQKVHFFTGDACLLEKYTEDGTLSRDKYDGVLLSNLLCRLPDPVSCLNGLSHLVNDGGVVVIVTPFSWLEEYTPRSQWLGGYYDHVTKKPIYSKDQLRELMEERGFEKIHEEEVPLIIREHQRKYQYIVSEATGWRKRPLIL